MKRKTIQRFEEFVEVPPLDPGLYLELKDGNLMLRMPDVVEALDNGKFQRVQEWRIERVPFDPAIYPIKPKT